MCDTVRPAASTLSAQAASAATELEVTLTVINSVPMSSPRVHACPHTCPQECDVLRPDVPMYVMNAAYGAGSTVSTGLYCNFCTKERCTKAHQGWSEAVLTSSTCII